jgi:hypothetical protein
MNSTKILESNSKGTRVEVFIAHGKTMLESEDIIQTCVNEVGSIATGETLKQFDTDGSNIKIGDQNLYCKGQVEKTYETPYGSISVARNVYQGARGGKTFCPLDQNARIVVNSTPRFAKIVSYKYSDKGAFQVAKDLEISNGRTVARSYIQNVSDAVGAIAILKEEKWNYEPPKLEENVNSVAIGLDGTCMYLKGDGYREAMVGTIALYNKKGERLHTTYVAANPEYGKETFIKRMEKEISQGKKIYSKSTFVGLADGAKDNWPFLELHTQIQTIDFYHVSEYLGNVASVVFKNTEERKNWMESTCHNLKHKQGAANRIYNELLGFRKMSLGKQGKEILNGAITYFKNNKHRMKYSKNITKNLPIGSGVTEAGCKVIVKQRLCKSGMKWKDRGAAIVLSLRTLTQTQGRWSQFWQKIDQYGVPTAA